MHKKTKGGTGSLLKIAFRNIWRNKRRTAFCAAAVGTASLFFVFFQSMQGGIIKCVNDTVQVFETGHIKVVSSEYEAENEYMPVHYPIANGKNWREIASSIQNINGVKAVFPRIVTIATLQENILKHAILWGFDIEAETAINNLNLTNKNNGLTEGRYPKSGNECAIGTIFARKANLKIGDRLPLKTISAQFSDKVWSPVITGIFNFDFFKYDERVIIADFERLQRLLTMNEGTQQLVIFVDDEKQSPLIAAKVQDLLGNESVVTDWNDNIWIVVQKMQEYMYMIIYLVFLIIASFLIINTMVMIVHERIKETGIMGSLGMTRAEIVSVFFFESLFLAGFGALCGVVIGGIITGILSRFPLRLSELYGNTYSETPIGNTVFFQFSFYRLFISWITGVVVASLFTLIPSLRSAFIEPVEALRK